MEMTPHTVGTIIHAGMTRQQARRALLEAGYRYLAGGSFSSVWQSRCRPDRVIKITKPDRGSEATNRAACERSMNPHLPKVAVTQRLACGGWATEVEHLRDCDYVRYEGFREHFHRVADGKELDRVPPLLMDALWAIKLEAAKIGLHDEPWDLHCGNIMLRAEPDGSETVVLTDLLDDLETLQGGHGHGGTLHDADSVRWTVAEEQAGVTAERDAEADMPASPAELLAWVSGLGAVA